MSLGLRQFIQKHRAKNRPMFLYIFLTFGSIAIDQALKLILFWQVKEPYLWSNYFGLFLFKNYQFAFSLPLPTPFVYLIYFFCFVVIGVWLFFMRHKLKPIDLVAWALVIAGGLSNVGERVITGYVKDYLFIFSGIFNLADGLILIGLVILLFKGAPNK